MNKAIVSDPIIDAELKREGDFNDLWKQMGEEFLEILLELKEEEADDVWINLNMTINGEGFQMSRTISLN